MKCFRACTHRVNRRMMSLLIGRWGLPLLLVAMVSLAGGAAAYVTSNPHDPAAVGMTTTSTAASVTGECTSIALPVRDSDIRIRCR